MIIDVAQDSATFETTAPTWQTFDTEKLPEHRLVALDETSGRVLVERRSPTIT